MIPTFNLATLFAVTPAMGSIFTCATPGVANILPFIMECPVPCAFLVLLVPEAEWEDTLPYPISFVIVAGCCKIC